MKNIKSPDIRLSNLIFYYVIYSFVGWCIETVYMSLSYGTFINRGFLNGPFCSIYGFGALLLIILLSPLKKKLYLFFIGSVVITTALEYITGFILESAFNKTWWSYSDQPFNLQGRIALSNSIIWGVISIAMIYGLHPLIQYLVEFIPTNLRSILSCLLIMYFVIDAIVVSISLTGLGSYISNMQLNPEYFNIKFEFPFDTPVAGINFPPR